MQPDEGTVPPATTWHQDKQANAQERIRQAIAHLLDTNNLPAQPTARFNALVNCGIGGQTLYKYKDLWHPAHLQPVENPPHPPGVTSGRTEGAPECPNLLAAESSNTPLALALSDRPPPPVDLISSNTQTREGGIAAIKQRLAEIRAMREYKRAAQQAQSEQMQLNLNPKQGHSPERLAQMQQWLESGDRILMAEAEAFFRHKKYN